MKRLTRDEIPAVVQGGGVDFRTQEVGDMSIAWVHLAAGTDLRPARSDSTAIWPAPALGIHVEWAIAHAHGRGTTRILGWGCVLLGCWSRTGSGDRLRIHRLLAHRGHGAPLTSPAAAEPADLPSAKALPSTATCAQ